MILLTGYIVGTMWVRAQDYGTDDVLARTTISVAAINSRPVTLSEVVMLIEQQTDLMVAFDADRVPLSAMVILRSSAPMTLAQVFENLAAQANVVFRRRNSLVAMWSIGDASADAGATALADAELDSVPLPAAESAAVATSTNPATAASLDAPKETAAEQGSPATAVVQPARQRTAPEADGTAGTTATAAGMDVSGFLTSLEVDDDVIQMESYSVSAGATEGSVTALSNMREKANVSMDFVSADEFAKFGAGDLSDIVFRMPGISVADGQFAVVRGLSDRFLSTTLNGLKLPSPDPEKQAFQLDLLPTSAVEAVIVSKTYEPKLWAESTGGAMDILTRAIPNDTFTKIGFGMKVNSNLFDDRLDYETNGNEFQERLGFGSKSRPAAGEITTDWEFVPSSRNEVPLGTSFDIEHANVIPLGGERQIGLLVSAENSSSFSAESGIFNDRFARLGAPPAGAFEGNLSDFEIDEPYPSQTQGLYDYTASSAEYATTAALGLGFDFNESHALKFSAIWVQTSDDLSYSSVSTVVEDPDTGEFELAGPVGPPLDNFPPTFAYYRANEYFRERNLTALQLSGKHDFYFLGELTARWAVQRGSASQEDSPFIEAIYTSPLADFGRSFEILAGNDAPVPITAVWATNEESQFSARLDFDWDFDLWGEEATTLSFGVAMDRSDRDVEGTGFIYSRPDSSNPLVATTPNGAVRQAAGSIDYPFEFDTTADRAIDATYVNLSLPLVWALTLNAGARYEDYSLASEGRGQWGVYSTEDLYNEEPGGGRYGQFLGTTSTGNPPFESSKWYPATSLQWEPLESLSLRLAYSETDGRASFREVGPFFNNSVYSGNLVVGNPALRPSAASSFDIRVDWSPSPNNSFSVSYFTKTISKPIEKFILDTRSVASYRTEVWVNNPGEADLSGFEAEFRHGLGAWADFLRDFSLGANVTLIDATVPEHPTSVLQATPRFFDPANVPTRRRLFDQPERIANVDFTWAKAEWGSRLTIAGYAISDVLVVSGLQAATFDYYEDGYTSWDLIYSQSLPAGLSLKVTAKNLNDPVRGTLHDPEATFESVPVRQYRAGRDYGISLSTTF